MSDIVRILGFEEIILKDILTLLEKQHKAVVINDISSMEAAAESLIEKGKELEKAENERKKLQSGDSIKKMSIINKELDQKLRSIKITISEIAVQKKTNIILLKQGINFNNRILNILSPKKSSMVYDNSGKLSK